MRCESFSICLGEGIITPTVTNPGEGVFTSTVGLDLDMTSGAINTDNSSIGAYLVTHQTEGTCPDSVSIEITIEDCSSLDEINVAFNLEPNPCTNAIDVTSDQGGSISIYSTFGEVVYTGIKNPGIPLQILTQNYSSGIYYISFHRQGKREVLKLIKL